MADEPVLADGIADYIAAFRATAAGPPTSPAGARLRSDLNARLLAVPCPAGMTVTTSFFVHEGRETGVRLYRPAAHDGAAIVYFHGGGFTAGSIESFESLAMSLAEASGALVVSVHYARLPHATPKALLDECFAALCWTVEVADILEIDAGRVAVAGDSAGAFVATQLCLMARERGGPAIACQLLCYGVYDIDATRASYATARDPVLKLPVLTAMVDAYRAADARDPCPLPPPLHARDLSALPPAILVEAEHDTVLEEGVEYAERLRDAGVDVDLRIAPGMIHGFLRALRFSQAARDEMRRLGDQARRRLQP